MLAKERTEVWGPTKDRRGKKSLTGSTLTSLDTVVMAVFLRRYGTTTTITQLRSG